MPNERNHPEPHCRAINWVPFDATTMLPVAEDLDPLVVLDPSPARPLAPPVLVPTVTTPVAFTTAAPPVSNPGTSTSTVVPATVTTVLPPAPALGTSTSTVVPSTVMTVRLGAVVAATCIWTGVPEIVPADTWTCPGMSCGGLFWPSVEDDVVLTSAGGRGGGGGDADRVAVVVDAVAVVVDAVVGAGPPPVGAGWAELAVPLDASVSLAEVLLVGIRVLPTGPVGVTVSWSLAPVGRAESGPGPSSPIYLVVLTGSIHRVSVNPPQFGPDPVSPSVQLVTAGWPGKRVDSALNSQRNIVSETGLNCRPPGSEGSK